MDAKEARKLAEENLQTRADNVYEIIQSHIEEYVKEGKTQLMYYDDIPEITMVKLLKEGYKITEVGNNGYHAGTKINW